MNPKPVAVDGLVTEERFIVGVGLCLWLDSRHVISAVTALVSHELTSNHTIVLLDSHFSYSVLLATLAALKGIELQPML